MIRCLVELYSERDAESTFRGVLVVDEGTLPDCEGVGEYGLAIEGFVGFAVELDFEGLPGGVEAFDELGLPPGFWFMGDGALVGPV